MYYNYKPRIISLWYEQWVSCQIFQVKFVNSSTYNNVLFNSFTEIKLKHKINYTHLIHNLINLDICVHLWYHHHNKGNKHIYHLKKFPCVTLFLVFVVHFCLVWFYCGKDTKHGIYLNKCLSAHHHNYRYSIAKHISRIYSSWVSETL